MSIVKRYINGLKNAYIANNLEKEWNCFEGVVYGASKDSINELKKIYPDIPKSLLEILEFVDGTYYRNYDEDNEILFYFFGSDLEEYPYYLLSSKQMVANKDLAYEYYGEYVDRLYDDEGVKVDKKIIDDSEKLNWLHFSDCMNNGGTSQLFIDFSPSKSGKKGQIVRYLHDPDEIEVIADSFDEYLNMLIDYDYDFIQNIDEILDELLNND